jgi:hypothetical protein
LLFISVGPSHYRQSGHPMPGFLFTANQRGAGKSKLVEIALSAVFGEAGAKEWPKEDKAITTLLESALFGFQPYFYIEEIEGFLKSAALNQIMQSNSYKSRTFHKQELRQVPNLLQIFAAGCDVKLTADLADRFLIVDLFRAEKTSEFKPKKQISSADIIKPEFRSNILAASWALLKNWQDCGSPAGSTIHNRFPFWSRVIGGIVQEAGFADPIVCGRDLDFDDLGAEFERVFKVLAERLRAGESRDFTVQECKEVAEELDVWNTLIRGAKDAKGESITFGKRLRGFKGRIFRDSKGRSFQFGRRESAKGSVYPLRVFES